MATNTGQYLLPEGELNENWFPEIDPMAFLRKRVEEATSRSDIEDLTGERRRDAIQAFVYMKAYRHIYRRKADDPNAWSSDGQGSEQQSNRQVQRWKEMAEEKESTFFSLVESSDSGSDLPGTQSVPVRSGYV